MHGKKWICKIAFQSSFERRDGLDSSSHGPAPGKSLVPSPEDVEQKDIEASCLLVEGDLRHRWLERIRRGSTSSAACGAL